MRKYYQATLFITAVFSIISLLFYRHEYNKLRYVLEVFNYFGTPNVEGIKSNCSIIETCPPRKLNLNLRYPLSAWDKLNDDLWIYSSYIINHNSIHTIAYGKAKPLSLGCTVFFQTSDSKLGQFKYNKINSSESINFGQAYTGYTLICHFDGDGSVPIGVSYHRKEQEDKKDILPVKIQPTSLNYHGSAVCVIPPSKVSNDFINMISFLSFHGLIYMNHFIIYDHGMQSIFHEKIENIAPDLREFTYEVLYWNFPISNYEENVLRSLIEMDCLFRTYNKVLYSAVISWNEFIVLKYHQTLSDLLKDFEQSRMSGNRFLIEAQNFCIQQQDNENYSKSWPMIFKKTLATSGDSEKNLVYVNKPHEILQNNRITTRKASSELITVNRYIYCDQYEAGSELTRNDTSIIKFAAEVQSSLLIKQFINYENLYTAV